MADEDNVIDPPEEAHDPALSSAAKDAFFANDPNASSPPAEPTRERPPAQGYEVRFRSSTVEEADFEAPEQNAKEVTSE
jgi:hypothetical protein